MKWLRRLFWRPTTVPDHFGVGEASCACGRLVVKAGDERAVVSIDEKPMFALAPGLSARCVHCQGVVEVVGA